MKKTAWIIVFVLLFLSSCNGLSSSSSASSSSSITSSSSSVSSSVPLVNHEGWNLVWNDEFDDEGLPDDTKWGYDTGGHGWGNNELQYYTERDLDNARVVNGNLIITARKEAIGNNAYSSARLVTRGKGDFLYGRMEARAKLPRGRGTWPAIWMLPTNWVYGGWPTSGEIDIMEHVGYDPNMVHSTVHTDTYNHTKNTQVMQSTRLSNVFDTYYTYAIEWEPGEIRSYVNNLHYATFTFDPTDVADGPTHLAWPFDQEFHFIFNIAVGGNWGGVQGVDENIFPTSMTVDYVRVFQKDLDENDVTSPTTIKNPVIHVTRPNSVGVSWDPSDDASGVASYRVSLNDAFLGNTSVPAYYVEDLQPETTYNLTVEAMDFLGNVSQPYTFTISSGASPTINQRIEAEHYVSQNGVRFETTTDEGGGQNAGWLDTGDYLDYELLIPEEGIYQLDVRIAGNASGGLLTLLHENQIKTTLNIPSTGGWQAWQTIQSQGFSLPSGLLTLRLRVDAPGFNMNYFSIVKMI